MTDAATRHFLDISGLDKEHLTGMIASARSMKSDADHGKPLAGKMLAMIFDKPSTRTRVSFDVGMRQLGGETIVLSASDMQIGRGETIADTARVLSRYVDAIMIRTSAHARLMEFAENATVPVINGLTDDSHPCQIMADVLTIEEKLGSTAGQKIAWSGDGNNVLNSLIEGASVFDYELAAAVPQGHEPAAHYLDAARKKGATVHITNKVEEAVAKANCVMTDTWASMGFEEEADGHNTFIPYQVNEKTMKHAQSDAIFMHCLPAHRGEEVTAEVMDGPQSVVFDQAENRLHIQKAILAWCLT